MNNCLRSLSFAVAASLSVAACQPAAAADLSINRFDFWYEGQQITFSARYRNNDADGASNTVRLRLIAVPAEGGGEELLLSETTAGEVAAQTQTTTTHTQSFNQIPPDGTYQVFMILDEADGDDFVERDRLAANSEFEVTVAAQEAAVRRRIAASVPCGSLFLPYTAATLLSLLALRFVVRRMR